VWFVVEPLLLAAVELADCCDDPQAQGYMSTFQSLMTYTL